MTRPFDPYVPESKREDFIEYIKSMTTKERNEFIKTMYEVELNDPDVQKAIKELEERESKNV